jgi:hypothetical protein
MRFAASLVRAALASALALAAWSAQAGFQSDITVQLLAPGGTTGDPTPLALSQTVTVANLASGITSMDGGDVGNFMLTGEHILFGDGVLDLRMGVGDQSNAGYFTGYLGDGVNHARYEFDNLDIAGQTIIDFMILGSSGFAAPADLKTLVHLIDAHTLSFDLDSVEIAQLIAGASNNFAQISIQLLTEPNGGGGGGGGGGGNVPEPGTWSLALIAALGARQLRRRG